MKELTELRSIYAELADRFFTVNYAGEDCFVVTAMSANPFNPMFPIVDVNLVSKSDLMPVKMLDQSTTESLIQYAQTKDRVDSWCLSELDFPITSDDLALADYYKTVGKLNED
jgi:hypothetical protein